MMSGNLDQLINALEHPDFGRAGRLIASDNTLLTTRNAAGVTVLDHYCESGDTKVVKWLCEKLTELKLPVDFYDEKFCATIQNLYHNDRKAMVEILLQYTAIPNLRQWLVQRQLVCILGANFLVKNNFILNERQVRPAESGFVIESVHLLYSAITHLLAAESRYANIKENVHNYYQNTKSKTGYALINTLIRRINLFSKPRIIFNSGFKGHGFAVSVKKQSDNDYQFSFYDANRPETEDLDLRKNVRMLVAGQTAVVRRINVPALRMKEFMRILVLNKNDKTAAEVYGWLDSLPEMLNTSYQYDQNILMNLHAQEKHRCYWENPRYAIYDLFVDEFGIEAGAKEFNNFLTSINLKVVDHFKKEFKDQYDERAIHQLEVVVSKNVTAEAPKSFIAKAIAAALIYLTGALCVTISIFAAINFPGWAAVGAALGPVGLIAMATVGIFLMAYQLIIPAVTSFITRDRENPAPVMVDLVNEEAVKKNNARLKGLITSTMRVSAALQVVPEAKPRVEPVVKVKTSITASIKNSWSKFFGSKNSAKDADPVINVKPPILAQPKPVITLQDDLAELWQLPARP